MNGNGQEFTQARINEIHRAMFQALSPVAEQYGVTIRRAGGRFEPLSATLKFALETTTDNGETQEARDFKEMAHLYDLQPDWLGKTVTCRRGKATIIGLCPRRSKFPVLLRLDGGKQLLFTVDGIRRQFGLKPVDRMEPA